MPFCTCRFYNAFILSFYKFIVNDIRNFVFGLAGATVYGFCKSRKQKFVMSFTITPRVGLEPTPRG